MKESSAVARIKPSALQAMKAMDRLEAEVDRASSPEDLEDIADQAAGLQRRFRPVKEVRDRAGEVWIATDVRLGEELEKLPKAKGTGDRVNVLDTFAGAAGGGPRMTRKRHTWSEPLRLEYETVRTCRVCNLRKVTDHGSPGIPRLLYLDQANEPLPAMPECDATQ